VLAKPYSNDREQGALASFSANATLMRASTFATGPNEAKK
jgi:hypothetical protein